MLKIPRNYHRYKIISIMVIEKAAVELFSQRVGIQFSRPVYRYFPCRGYTPIFIESKRAGTSVSSINITLYQ